jgi:hypothetical protein
MKPAIDRRRLAMAVWTATILLTLAGAVEAQTASAHVFESTLSSTTITGTQTGNHVIEWAGNKITCKKAMFDGTQYGKEEETITVSVAYDECTAFSIVGVHLDMGSCQYEYNANESVSIVGANCDSDPITYEANAGILGKCLIKMGATGNANLKTIGYANSGGTINLTTSVRPLTYTQEGGLCGSHTEGRYTEGKTNFASTNGASISWE